MGGMSVSGRIVLGKLILQPGQSGSHRDRENAPVEYCGFVLWDVTISLAILVVIVALVLQSFVSFNDSLVAAQGKEFVALQLTSTAESLRSAGLPMLGTFSASPIPHAHGTLTVSVDVETRDGALVRLPLSSPLDPETLRKPIKAIITANFLTPKGHQITNRSTVMWGE